MFGSIWDASRGSLEVVRSNFRQKYFRDFCLSKKCLGGSRIVLGVPRTPFKCDMVSTTCSKMLSNATWFRQHVPNLPNLPTYQPTNLHLYLYLFLVHAQHSCACTTLLCMHWRGQGPRPGPNKKAAAPRAGPGGRFFVGSWPWALAPPVHAQECCACTRVLCMHKK